MTPKIGMIMRTSQTRKIVTGSRYAKYASIRDPALRPDGEPYCTAMKVPAEEVRTGDLFPSLGTVMSVQKLADGRCIVNGRLLHRVVGATEVFTVVRRHWE